MGRLVAVLAAIVVVACVGAFLGRAAILALLDPVGHPRLPAAALQGTVGRGAAILCSVNLSQYERLALPSPTVLTVLEVPLADGGRERRVVLNRPGRDPAYLGPLTRQLAPAPVETMFLDFGAGRVIIGHANPTELELTGGTITSATKREEGLGGCGTDDFLHSYVGFRGFVSPLSGNPAEFDHIARVQIGSPMVRIVDTPFDPPLDASGFWVTVP